MKLSEQAKQDNHISMLEMEIDKLSKDIIELENRVDDLEAQEEHLKEIIKSLAEVL
jgi:predicted  nucleic acid-binding Zn-ribbon protein